MAGHDRPLFRRLRPVSVHPRYGDHTLFEGRTYHVARQFLNREGWSLVLFSGIETIAYYRFFAILATFTLCILVIGFFVSFQKSLGTASSPSIPSWVADWVTRKRSCG